MNVTAVLDVKSPPQPPERPVLAVDLDGTLVKTDLLAESVVGLLKQKPWRILSLPFWLLKGRAYFKQQVARRVSLDVAVLPYREEVLEYVKSRRAQGSTIVLATAADTRIAHQVADHLRLFDLILASDGTTNLSGQTKRDRLVREFGESGFDYAGNDRHDLSVWAAARKAIVVNPSFSVRRGVARMAQVDRVFEDSRSTLADRFKALRPQHWLKNLLVFVPLLAAHRVDEFALLGKLFLAFLALGLYGIQRISDERLARSARRQASSQQAFPAVRGGPSANFLRVENDSAAGVFRVSSWVRSFPDFLLQRRLLISD